ncbi:MAG: hypothetical protein IPL46_07235 [Saprospiraceae bacterium]|nr:hypothetical protein [Saprospiraceae bacterium]
MRKTEKQEEYLIFKRKYEGISDLKLPIEYLDKSDVFVFTEKDEIVGGFILGKKGPYRTIEVFVSKSNLEHITEYFTEEVFCEVCCFWIERKFRKNPISNAKFWLKMAYAVKAQENKFILFGTNSEGLAKMYGYPKNSLLFHQDFLANRGTFIFLARRRDFARGVWEIVISKFLRRERNRNIIKKDELEKALIYELSK